MEKTFCDYCAKEVGPVDAKYTVLVSNDRTDKTISDQHACSRCIRRVRRALAFLVRDER